MDASSQPELVGIVGGRVAAGQVLEMSIPAKDFGPHVSFTVTVSHVVNGGRVVVQHVPAQRPITVDVPGADFSSKHWIA